MDNRDSSANLELVLDRIFDTLDRVVEKIDTNEKDHNTEIKEVKEEIRAAKQEYKKLLEHMEIIYTLGQNLSSEGLKELIADVSFCKTYIIADKAMEQIKESSKNEKEQGRKSREAIYWRILLFVAGAVLTSIGWLINRVLNMPVIPVK